MRKFLPLGVAALALAWGTAQAQTAPAPADQQPGYAAPARPMRSMAPRQRRAVEAGAEPNGMAPPTGDYRGGAGSPYSATATNITGGQHGELGARLPNPDASSDTPEGLLAAAARALDRNQTGAAQQALEMAETRALTRTADPSMANQPDTARMVQQISAARQALGRRDLAGAKAAVQAAMAAPVPPRGPTVTTMPVPYR